MYHINFEGKIYPCKARILKCPYGENRHAETEVELYYKLMKTSSALPPADAAVGELLKIGRLKSLYCLSPILEKVKYPIEVIVSTLAYAIEYVNHDNVIKGTNRKYERIFREGADLVCRTMLYGVHVPSYVPASIKKEGKRQFHEIYGGRYINYAPGSRDSTGLKTRNPIRNMRPQFDDYNEWEKYKITEFNHRDSLGWLKRDFQKFSHDLNTSKMITQPVFYGNVDKAIEIIKNMEDFELLATYDDTLISDRDLFYNIYRANHFEYTYRKDLTKLANIKVKEWYDRNKALAKDWRINTPKRTLLSLEMAKELDKRGMHRQDKAIGDD